MKILCLGNNTSDTDEKASQLAIELGTVNLGLISTVDIQPLLGLYHTSIYDLNLAQILELVEKFDKLILLDQPINQWSHPEAFYLTVKTADQAESKITVERQIDDTSIHYFENLVEQNKSFCIFPFIELMNDNGSTTVCCRSKTPVTKLENLKDWQTDTEYEKIRDNMIAGKMMPEHCDRCYRYEQQGIKSARQQETVEWANKLGIKSIDDLKKFESPAYYEVRPSNVCNLMCRSCGPQWSNLIEKEHNTIGWHDSSIRYNYTNFDFVKFDNLKKLYVAGGEPTASTDLYNFMQKCIDENNTDFEFIINTNAHKISTRFIEIANQFSNLQFIVSIDGFEQVNDYVRWLSHWGTTINNAKLLDKEHVISFNVVVSIYTISRLDQLLEFLDKEFDNPLVHCVFGEFGDDILNPNLYPNKKYILEKLKSIQTFTCYKRDQLLKSFIDGLIIEYDQNKETDLLKLQKFFEYNDTLDKSRGSLLKDYIPELDQFRELCYSKV